MLRLHLLISGMVTGVGFRYFVTQNARKMGVSGWVKNIDNNVETAIEGEKTKVEKILELCKEGPAGSWVKEVKVLEKKEINNISVGFEIL